MDEATGEAAGSGLRVAFDRRLKLDFHGATVTSDAGLLAFRELDDALGLTALAADTLIDPRTGMNGRHSLPRPALLRELRFIRRRAGTGRVGWWRRSSGILASCTRASVSF
jgi:hypothetical protein